MAFVTTAVSLSSSSCPASRAAKGFSASSRTISVIFMIGPINSFSASDWNSIEPVPRSTTTNNVMKKAFLPSIAFSCLISNQAWLFALGVKIRRTSDFFNTNSSRLSKRALPASEIGALINVLSQADSTVSPFRFK